MRKTVKREYDAKTDSKKRITLRSGRYEYYHVTEMEDGSILLEPRVLTSPLELSEKTLKMMDASMEEFRKGNVSDPVDLSDMEV